MKWLSLVILLVFSMTVSVSSHWWSRRRRRRRIPQPPPEPNCIVSAWSSWTQCNRKCDYGHQERTRIITRRPSTFCREPSLWQDRTCGDDNGGCEHDCHPSTGLCSCPAGYSLLTDGKRCQDINECLSNGGRGPCSHICRNRDGSYRCRCPGGYYLHSDKKTCIGRDCGQPALPNCLTPTFSNACKKVTVTCATGTLLNSQCHFSCPANFALAKITNKALPFARNMADADFSNINTITTCSQRSANQPIWSSSNVFKDYYCRRTNDPPTNIAISQSTIKEHSPVGTIVAVISANDPQQITYSVQQSSGFFFFRAQGNKLVNTWKPRWKNLQGLEINDYHVIIRATDNGSPPMWSEKNFTITVVNVNDPPHSIRISNNSVMDTATLNHVVGTLSAVDGDGPRGRLRTSDFHWKLIDNDKGRFSLVGPNVAVAAALDHQAHQYHRLIINCTDKDPVDPRSTQASIIINVINTNDSPKDIKFNKNKLYENATSGFVVGRLVATDQDGDRITFSISQSDPTSLDTFQLGNTVCSNKTTNGIFHSECKADVLLKKQINYEAKNSYSLKVKATDPTGSFAITDYFIHVINLNEAPTDITLSHDKVPENSPVGTVVGQIMITDPDTQQRSPQGHSCSVTPSTPFTTSGLNLIVADANALNYENKQSYMIVVNCTDTGVPPLSFSKQFVINVQDVNEPPRYLQLSRNSITEDSPVGSTVGRLSSSDPDVRNTRLTFRVKSPVNSAFGIAGSARDTLVTTRLLDYEAVKQIDILISVTDDGGLSLEKFFTINIINKNEAPTDLSVSPTKLPENSPAGNRIGSITVTDPDANSTASCRIVQGNTGYLAISGLQLVAGSTKVDYEALGSTKSLSVKLRCADEYGLFIEKIFHIEVTDVNEPPTEIQVTLHQVPENQIGVIVGQISVKDPDVGQGHLCKVLANNTESSLFAVNHTTMQIKTIAALNFELQRRHEVTLRCTDAPQANHIRFTIFKDIAIDVIDMNEIPLNPCFRKIYVDEAASNGSVVWSFKTRDPDNEEYELAQSLGMTSYQKKQSITFSLAGNGHGLPFTIADKQYLVKSGTLNRLKKSVYSLPVNVTDDGMLIRYHGGKYVSFQGPKASSVYTCATEVLATGDARLSLDIALSSNFISEDASNGTRVGTLSIINGEAGETYILRVARKQNVPFRVVGNELILVIGSSPLDYEKTNSTGVGIIAIGSKGKTVEKIFLIRITNVNERPVRICLISNHTVHEKQMPDQIIGHIAIEDPDHKETHEICSKKSRLSTQGQNYICSIESNDVDVTEIRKKFFVDKNLDLHSNWTFVYRNKKAYSIPINCKDIHKPIHKIQISVVINVIEASVQPTWELSLSSNNVSEDALNGTIIGTVSVVGAAPVDTYSFKVANRDQPFRMDGNKLIVIAKAALDYEIAKSIMVTIVSTNLNGKQVEKSFSIKVTDVNEKPVNMCLLNIKSIMPEKSPADSILGKIAIADPDHPESIGICKDKTSSVSQFLSYTCDIWSSTVNVDGIKMKFYIDQHFNLNRKGDFNYKTKKVYNIPIICRDRLKPIHLIQRTFTMNVKAPECPPRHSLANAVCICASGFTGAKCDRDSNICKVVKCNKTEVCVSHISAATRCIPRVNQVPILLRIQYSTVSKSVNQYKIESYVESIFEGKRTAGQTIFSLFNDNVISRRRRDLHSDVNVEAATSQQASVYSYVVFVAMDPNNKYQALPGDKLCALLNGTDLRCVNAEDCKILEKAGIECPYTFGSTNGGKMGKNKAKETSTTSGAKAWMYGVGSTAFIAIIVFVLVCFVLRRKKRKSDEPIHFAELNDDVVGHANPIYDISPEESPDRTKRSLMSRNNLTMQLPKRQPTDIKTFENALYNNQKSGKFDVNNPMYGATARPVPDFSDQHIYDSVGKLQGKQTVDMLVEEEKRKEKENQFVDLPREGKRKYIEPPFDGLKKQDNRKVNNINKKNNNDSKC